MSDRSSGITLIVAGRWASSTRAAAIAPVETHDDGGRQMAQEDERRGPDVEHVREALREHDEQAEQDAPNDDQDDQSDETDESDESERP